MQATQTNGIITQVTNERVDYDKLGTYYRVTSNSAQT